MTRIFDALKKARPPVEPPAREAEPAPPPAAPTPIHSVMSRTAAGAGAARPTIDRGEIVPLGPAAPFDANVTREMAGLRINLEALLPARAPRTLAFLSAQPGEGTSTVLMQFAESLARETGQRVLVVDAHLHRSAALIAEARAAAHGVDRGGRAGVDLFPLGERFRRTGSLSPRLARDLMDQAGPGYDWVLVDAPPLLEAPESAPLGALADGVVLVVRSGRTKRPVLSRATDLLRRSGANVLGTVLNRRRLEIPGFIYRRI
jgi:Mrp family chromosome partitioning ATPase